MHLKTHSADKCSGQNCCIHNPSAHHMRDWPMRWRDDKGVMERICPHGVGHPDPDDAAHNLRVGKEHLAIHGCDGCCRPPETETKVIDARTGRAGSLSALAENVEGLLPYLTGPTVSSGGANPYLMI